MLKKRLPPLEPLIAFEAAARLLSFTRAGEELHLTQAAISQLSLGSIWKAWSSCPLRST